MYKVFSTFEHINEFQDNSSDAVIITAADKFVRDVLKKDNLTKSKKLYRIAGQSGTGKTTQLLPAILRSVGGQKPITIAVREFAPYHPNYDEIVKNSNPGEVRERTNSFALRTLYIAFSMIVRMGYLIVLDMTLLAPELEEYMLEELKQNDYAIEYHIMAVNWKQSEAFKKKRKASKGFESGKAVLNFPSKWFYKYLPKSISHISEIAGHDVCYIWTAYNENPIYFGALKNGALDALAKGRKLIQKPTINEDDLLNSKIQFLSSLKIETMKWSGFCFGVRHAIDIAESNPNSMVVNSEIVHNDHEVQRLKQDFNVSTCNTSTMSVIIQAHGIPFPLQSSLEKTGYEIHDATCPNVKHVQNKALELSKLGYYIILYGKKNHPEVLGILSYTSRNILVIDSLQELKQTFNQVQRKKIALISQTTKEVKVFDSLVGFLKDNVEEDSLLICNTICLATIKKQQEALEIGRRADIGIIIGGLSSSNAHSLHDTFRYYGCDTYLIQEASQLQSKWFTGKKYCGVAGGNSTPDYLIKEITDAIRAIGDSIRKP